MPQLQVVDTTPNKPEPTGVQEFFSKLSNEYRSRQDQDVFAGILEKAQKNKDTFSGLRQAEIDLERSTISPSNRIQKQQQLSNMRKLAIEEGKVINAQAKQQQDELRQNQALQQQQALQQSEREKTRLALEKSGATPEQIALYEASPVGGQTQIVSKIVESQARQRPSEMIPSSEGLVDYDKGLTPAERVKRQDSRYSIQAPLVSKNADSLKGVESEGLSIGLLRELNNSGQVGEGLSKLNINPSTGSLIIPQLATPQEQLFVKTVNDFTVKAKESFGGNVTNFEIDRFMQRLPSLANSKQGRALIMEQMGIINELNQLEKKELQNVFDQYGVRNIDYADAERLARSRIKDQKEDLRKKYLDINRVISSEEENAKKQLKKRTKPGYDLVQKQDGTFKQVPKKNVDVYEEKADSEDGDVYDSIYGAEDVDASGIEPTKTFKEWAADQAIDFTKQFGKETLVGAAGTYGDLLDLAGINQYNPEKDVRDLETMQRMDQPGYQPTFADIEQLSSDEILPQQFVLPTSQQARGGLESLGAPGEPTTAAGGVGKRAGGMLGSGLAFGQGAALPPLAAGIAGQAVEELGGGPLLQAAAEIATLLATGKVQSNNQASDKIKALKDMGYTDEQITLAINSANKGGVTAKYASKGEKTKQAFEDFATKSDEMVTKIISKEIPGVESGISKVKEMASDAYGKVITDAAGLTIKDASPFIESTESVIKHLSNTLGTNPDAQSFIGRLKQAAEDATKNPNADKMINFYKELNQMGQWIGRSERDHLIGLVKDGVKNTFKKEGTTGNKLAQEFELVNKGIQKAYMAEDMMKILNKANVNEVYDMGVLDKLLSKKQNIDVFNKAIGPRETANLKMISNIGKQVKDFDKAWKGVIPMTERIIAGTTLTPALLHDVYSGNLFLTAGLAGATVATRKLMEKSLTSPKFQNLIIRGLHAIKTGSPKSFKSVTEAMVKDLESED